MSALGHKQTFALQRVMSALLAHVWLHLPESNTRCAHQARCVAPASIAVSFKRWFSRREPMIDPVAWCSIQPKGGWTSRTRQRRNVREVPTGDRYEESKTAIDRSGNVAARRQHCIG